MRRKLIDYYVPATTVGMSQKFELDAVLCVLLQPVFPVAFNDEPSESLIDLLESSVDKKFGVVVSVAVDGALVLGLGHFVKVNADAVVLLGRRAGRNLAG